MTTMGATEGNIIATIIVTHMPRNSGKLIDAAGPASAIPMLPVWPIPRRRPEVIESAPEVRSMNSQARAAKLSRTMNTTAADVRSAPTGQSLLPVPEARPCVTANLPDVRCNPHAPPNVTVLAGPRLRRTTSQYYAARSEPSRVSQLRDRPVVWRCRAFGSTHTLIGSANGWVSMDAAHQRERHKMQN